MSFLWWIVIVWISSAVLSFYIRTRNAYVITIGELVFMILLGPLILIAILSEWDTIVWKSKEKKK